MRLASGTSEDKPHPKSHDFHLQISGKFANLSNLPFSKKNFNTKNSTKIAQCWKNSREPRHTLAHACTAEITAASAICKQKESLVPPSRFQNKLNRENGYRKSRIESWPIGSNQNKLTASERNSWREVNKSLSSKYFSSTRK